MGNALITRNTNTAIEVPADYVPVAGIEQLSADDFTLPVMKLVQSTTKVEGVADKLGKWYRTDTGETTEAPHLIMIGIAKQRVLFESTYSGEGKPLCRSDNGKEPRAEYIGQTLDVVPPTEKYEAVVREGPGNFEIMPLCSNCPLSQWVNGNKPPCKLSDSWAAVTSDGDPVIVRFGGSAAKMGGKLRNLARIATVKRKPLYIKLGSHFEQGDNGNYYVPDILAATEPISTDLIDLAKTFASVNLAARYDDLADEDAPKEEAQKRRVIDLNDESNGPDWPDENNMPF